MLDYQFPSREDFQATDHENDRAARIADHTPAKTDPVPQELYNRWQIAAAEVSAYRNWMRITSSTLNEIRGFPVSLGDGWLWVKGEKAQFVERLDASLRFAMEEHRKAREVYDKILLELSQYENYQR